MLVIIDKIPDSPPHRLAAIEASIKDLGGTVQKKDLANHFYTVAAQLPDDADVPESWKKVAQ